MFKKAAIQFTCFIILLLLVSGIGADVQAQKRSKKKNKGKVEADSGEPKIVSAEEKRKAEMYHAQAEKYYILEEYAKAFVLYQKSLEHDPANATAYYKTAQIYQKTEEYEKALLNAKKAVEMDNTNKYFYLVIAEIYTKQSNFEQAALVYEEMIAKCALADDYLFDLAAIYLYQKNYDKALGIYDRIENKYGINEQVIGQKQKLYLKQSKLDEAIQEGEKLINAFPGESRYVIMLADIFISNNQPEKAVPYLEEILEFDATNPQALLMLSDIYRNQGDTEKSNIYLVRAFGNGELELDQKLQVMVRFMEELPDETAENLCLSLGEKIKTSHPDDPNAYAINGDLMMKLNKNEEAHAYYQKSIELGANNYNIWQNLVQLEVQLSHFDQAIENGEKALEMFPNQVGLYWFLGTAYLADNHDEEAVEILEQGKKTAGTNDDLKALFNAQLGDAYNNLEQHKKSNEAYEAALAYDPDNDHVLNNYSYFLALRKEKLELALKMSTKLVERNPDNPTFLDTHAWVLYMNGNYRDARTYIEKALEGDEISGTLFEHYGDILFKLGEVDSAVQQWQKAKGMDQTSDLIDKKIADRQLYE